MDLIYTCYANKASLSLSAGGSHSHCRGVNVKVPADADRWISACSTLCSISSQNVLLFSTSSPHHAHAETDAAAAEAAAMVPPVPAVAAAAAAAPGAAMSNLSSASSPLNAVHRVFVCDVNTPWDVHCIGSRASEVTLLKWNEEGNAVVIADAEGKVEMWQMQEAGLISKWKCIDKQYFPKETFFKAKFVYKARKTYLNNDKMDSSTLYNEKFNCSSGPEMGVPFGQRRFSCCVLVSTSGMVAAISVSQVDFSSQCATKSLSGQRTRVLHADLTYLSDGKLVVATSNGSPTNPINVYTVRVTLEAGKNLQLTVGNFPSIFLQSSGAKTNSEEDACRAVSGLCFVKEHDSDALLVSTEHNAGGRVELWELKNSAQTTHKIFSAGGGENGLNGSGLKISLPVWKYDEVFMGPPSQVASVATPVSTVQTGTRSPCYVAVAYADGSIQCLLRDSLQHIGSVELPKAGNMVEAGEPSPSKKFRCATGVKVCSMAFTATGNALVAIDSLGQLYLYRMSPISDPGGPHTVPYLVTMFEYCLTSGIDFWDLTVCTKLSHVEPLSEKLTVNFESQPPHIQGFYFGRFMAIKSSLLRLGMLGEQKSSDCSALYMMRAISGAFRGLIRTSEGCSSINEKNQLQYDKVIGLLDRRKDDIEVDRFVQALQPHQKEFAVDATVLQNYQLLIQWVTTLALHIAASIPDYKRRRGIGYDIYTNSKAMAALRELLFLVRLWGSNNPSCLPHFTKTAESFDVVPKLFEIVTKQMNNVSDESLNDDCLRLPSQVMIPPLNLNQQARGASASAVLYNRAPLSYEFSVEPESEVPVLSALTDSVFIEGAMSNAQLMDCVRHVYLGKSPYSVKMSTRCCAMTMAQGTPPVKPWDKRWTKNFPNGGNWTLAYLDKF